VARVAEKDYAKIGASRITFPSQQNLKPKILVYARNKKGKTTFLTSVGRMNILIADPEHGTSKMKTKDPHIWPIRRWADMDEFYQFCRLSLPCPKCKPEHDFTWAGVDGMTRITNMALRFVMKREEERNLDRQPGMVDRRDYGKSGELVKELLTNFHNLDMGVVYTAQERQEEAQDSEEDSDSEAQESVYVPDLPKGVRGMTNSLVDVIGRLYVVKAVVKGEEKPQRRLWLGESTKYDTGYRSEYRLPEFVKYPTIPKLVNLMETGSAK
jgi:hypothetical protein